MDIAILFLFGYNPSRIKNMKGVATMEQTAPTQLQFLRDTACALVAECTDEDLLDLICKLLLPPEG